MPPVRKVDLLPPPLLDRLKRELSERGFGGIVEVTEALNEWLAEEGLELRLGKTAVGEFSKLLKQQQQALGLAEQLLAEMDVERESDLHKVLMQMIATSAVKLFMAASEDGEDLSPDDLYKLGRMLRDIMASVGIREKVIADERKRIEEEAAKAERARLAETFEKEVLDRGLIADQEAARAARRAMGFPDA